MDRAGLVRAQTPQAFAFDGILAAHRAASGNEADDVEVARKAGMQVLSASVHLSFRSIFRRTVTPPYEDNVLQARLAAKFAILSR